MSLMTPKSWLIWVRKSLMTVVSFLGGDDAWRWQQQFNIEQSSIRTCPRSSIAFSSLAGFIFQSSRPQTRSQYDSKVMAAITTYSLKVQAYYILAHMPSNICFCISPTKKCAMRGWPDGRREERGSYGGLAKSGLWADAQQRGCMRACGLSGAPSQDGHCDGSGSFRLRGAFVDAGSCHRSLTVCGEGFEDRGTVFVILDVLGEGRFSQWCSPTECPGHGIAGW